MLTILIAFVMAFSCSAVDFATGDDLEFFQQTATNWVMSIWIAKLTLKCYIGARAYNRCYIVY